MALTDSTHCVITHNMGNRALLQLITVHVPGTHLCLISCLLLLLPLQPSAASRYGYRPWAAAPAAQPWLSRYQTRAAATGSSSASRQYIGQPRQYNDTRLQHGELEDGDVHGEHNQCMQDVTGPWPGGQEAPATAEPLLLHCREVLLLRPRKAPVRVVAPLPASMRELLHAMDWK